MDEEKTVLIDSVTGEVLTDEEVRELFKPRPEGSYMKMELPEIKALMETMKGLLEGGRPGEGVTLEIIEGPTWLEVVLRGDDGPTYEYRESETVSEGRVRRARDAFQFELAWFSVVAVRCAGRGCAGGGGNRGKGAVSFVFTSKDYRFGDRPSDQELMFGKRGSLN